MLVFWKSFRDFFCKLSFFRGNLHLHCWSRSIYILNMHFFEFIGHIQCIYTWHVPNIFTCKFVTKENNTESALTTYLSVALIVYLCRVPILSPSCTKVLGLLRPVHILHNAPVVSRAQSTRRTFALSGGRWGCLGTTARFCQEWTPSAVSVLCVSCRWGTPSSSHRVDTDSVTSASKNTSGIYTREWEKWNQLLILSTIVCQGVFFFRLFFI